MRFVDTNILLYAISTDPTERDKALVANRILDAGEIALSVQVLQEFYVQATRATRRDPITHDQAAGLIESWHRFPVQPIGADLMRAALGTRQRFRISYWDAAIIEAARAMGCTGVLSEDLGHGTDYSGIVIQDPFRDPTGAAPAR